MAIQLRDPAALPPRAGENLERVSDPILWGRYREGADYRLYRARGSATWLLMYGVAGRGWVRSSGGAAYECGAHDLLLYEPDREQEYGTMPGARWDFHWVHFTARPAGAPWLDLPAVRGIPGLRAVPVGPAGARRRILAAFAEVARDLRLGGARRAELARNAVERILLLALNAQPAGGRRDLDPRIQEAVEGIAQDPAAARTVTGLAAAAGLSPSRFAHLFRAATGQPVMDFVIRLRLEEAAKLLNYSPASVGDIAARTGFNSPIHFSTMFRRRFGRGPAAWRRLARATRGRRAGVR